MSNTRKLATDWWEKLRQYDCNSDYRLTQHKLSSIYFGTNVPITGDDIELIWRKETGGLDEIKSTTPELLLADKVHLTDLALRLQGIQFHKHYLAAVILTYDRVIEKGDKVDLKDISIVESLAKQYYPKPVTEEQVSNTEPIKKYKPKFSKKHGNKS